MIVASYGLLVMAAVVCSVFSLPVAIVLGAIAATLVFRAELRWFARRVRAPRVTLTPAPPVVPQREGASS